MVIANRSASFLFLSASISERITLFAPVGIFLSGSTATTGSGFGGSLGPETDFDLPENDNLLDPSLRFNTVFILVINLFTPFSFFSSGLPFAGVLMAAMN